MRSTNSCLFCVTFALLLTVNAGCGSRPGDPVARPDVLADLPAPAPESEELLAEEEAEEDEEAEEEVRVATSLGPTERGLLL